MTSISEVHEEATLLSGTSSGLAVRRSLRCAKSLVGLMSTGVTAVRSGTPAQRAGRWQSARVAVTKTKAKAKSTTKKATNACAQSDDESDEGVVRAIVGPSLSPPSPTSALVNQPWPGPSRPKHMHSRHRLHRLLRSYHPLADDTTGNTAWRSQQL